MDQPSGMDQMDRRILRTLSNYERLTPLQIWYELSGDGAVTRRLTETEILNRLESLRDKGLVERVTGIEVSSDPRLSIYRVRTSTRMAGAIGDDLSRD